MSKVLHHKELVPIFRDADAEAVVLGIEQVLDDVAGSSSALGGPRPLIPHQPRFSATGVEPKTRCCIRSRKAVHR